MQCRMLRLGIAARDAPYAHAMNFKITLPCSAQRVAQQIERMKQQEVALKQAEGIVEIILVEQADIATSKLFQHRMFIYARRVVDSGIAPVINTGIAHRQAGVGQIGAGIARAPLACFAGAIAGLAAALGVGDGPWAEG